MQVPVTPELTSALSTHEIALKQQKSKEDYLKLSLVLIRRDFTTKLNKIDLARKGIKKFRDTCLSDVCEAEQVYNGIKTEVQANEFIS